LLRIAIRTSPQEDIGEREEGRGERKRSDRLFSSHPIQ